jgi:hypothetical protein
MIIPIGMIAVPKSVTKRIESRRVFLVTTLWSLFAYIWMIIILLGFSPYIIDIWEATLTLVFFVAAVLTAYLADVNVCEKWSRPKLIVAGHKEVTIAEQGGMVAAGSGAIAQAQQIEDAAVDQAKEDTTFRFNSIKVSFFDFLI